MFLCVWKDAGLWAHWKYYLDKHLKYSSDKHLNYLGPVSYFFFFFSTLRGIPSGCTIRGTAVNEGLMAVNILLKWQAPFFAHINSIYLGL